MENPLYQLQSMVPSADRMMSDAMRRAGLPSLNTPPQYISEDEKDSILSRIGTTSLAGIGAVGSGMDVGGALVRNIIAGRPVGEIFRNPLSQQGRISGREQLTEWGLTPKNNEDWSWEDLPYDIAGLGYEILTDPLTYATFGMSALGKAGKAAKAAGMMPDLISAAAKQGIGKRALRVGSKLKDFTHNAAGNLTPLGDKYMSKLTRAASATGSSVNELLDKPIGSYMQFLGMPVGTGDTALKVANAADKVAGAIRYSPPMRVGAALFDYGVKGAVGDNPARGAKIQDAMQTLSRAENTGLAEARGDMYESVVDSYRGGWFDAHKFARENGTDLPTANRATSELGIALTDYVERGDRLGNAWWNTRHGQRIAALPQKQRDAMINMAQQVKATIANDPTIEAAEGIKSKLLDDYYIDYLTRQHHRFPGDKAERAGRNAYQFTHPALMQREYSNMPGGTAVIQEMSMDKTISGIAHNKGFKKSDLAQSVNYIKQAYGNDIVPELQDITAAATARASGGTHPLMDMLPGDGSVWIDPVVMRNQILDRRAKQLAGKIGNLDPRHAANGIPIYKVNPAESGLWRHEASSQLQAATDGVYEFLGSEAVFNGTLSDTGKNLYDLFKATDGLDADQASVAFFKRLEKSDPDKFNDIMVNTQANMSPQMMAAAGNTPPYRLMAMETDVPQWAAKESERFMKVFSAPKEASIVAQSFDNFLKVWKRSVTIPWPAFHTRNFISGLVRNIVGDAFDIQSAQDNLTLLFSNKPINGAAKRYGFTGMTDAQATEAIRKSMFANRVIEHHSGMGGEVLTMAGEVTDIPGVTKVFPQATPGIGAKERWNPLSEYSRLQRIGSAGSYSVEGINRGTAYLNALKKGYDPTEASKVVDRLQVRYENLSEFERSVMKRIAPFYGFTRGVIPWTVKELVERPGGKLAQVAKATARSRDEGIVPDEVSGTASVKLSNEAETYLSGIGLMEEPVYSLLDPAVKFLTMEEPATAASDMFREVLSQTNPALKGIVELATGKSTYFGGAEPGGRDLASLDPPFARMVENIGVSMGAAEPNQNVRPIGHRLFGEQAARLLEYGIGASPVSRIVHETKKVSDYRKPWLERLINLAAGPRIISVTPEAKSAMEQELTDAAMRNYGGVPFTRVSVPEYKYETLSENSQNSVDQLRAVQRLLTKIRKDRAKQVQ